MSNRIRKCPAAVALGKMAKGVKKTMTQAALDQRKAAALAPRNKKPAAIA